jgi:hypothetical protein
MKPANNYVKGKTRRFLPSHIDFLKVSLYVLNPGNEQ